MWLGQASERAGRQIDAKAIDRRAAIIGPAPDVPFAGRGTRTIRVPKRQDPDTAPAATAAEMSKQ